MLVASAMPSCAAVTPAQFASVTSPSPIRSVGSRAGIVNARPTAATANALNASRRQPIRSASDPNAGPKMPRSHKANTMLVTAGENENGGRSSRKTTYENVPTKVKKNALPAAVV